MRRSRTEEGGRATLNFSIVISTAGRNTLAVTLRSIDAQKCDGDETIIIGDTHTSRLPDVEKRARTSDARYFEHDAGRHAWGHPQRNAGIATARLGNYLLFIDDDDVFTPGAFASIRRAIAKHGGPAVFMFRFVTPYREILWCEKEIKEQRVGGHSIVVQNDPAHLGKWTDRYEGDFDFIRSTLDLWGGDRAVVWQPEVIAVCRP